MNMFSTSAKTASLSSGLLARKGQARPAMRPQGFVGYAPQPSDDLGWNDMGDEMPPMEASPVSAHSQVQPVVPPVLRQRHALANELTSLPVPTEPEVPDAKSIVAEAAIQPEPETAPVPVPTPAPEPVAPVATRSVSLATAERLQRETMKGKKKQSRKAAFTLRLDGERHLRLRLAAAICGDSAQNLVTEALDALLNSIPEVEALANQLPDRGGSKPRGKK